MHSPTSPCVICSVAEWTPRYRGPIRIGKFGSLSRESQTIWRCGGCQVDWLEQATSDYESDDYRQLVDGAADVASFHRTHDGEQADKLRLLGTSELRGKVLADFGAGGGSFLDLVGGMAGTTLAIEPTASFHEALRAGGHILFPYGRDVSSEWRGQVDLAVCFSVVEHVEDPLQLFKEIRALLKPGGRALVSTPNRDDWLLQLLPEHYGSFFYRQVHRWYFDAQSLANVAGRAGFKEAKPFYVHRFDFANFLLWLRDRRPSGMGRVDVPPVLQTAFAPALEQSGRADYLYAWLYA